MEGSLLMLLVVRIKKNENRISYEFVFFFSEVGEFNQIGEFMFDRSDTEKGLPGYRYSQ